MKLTSVQDENSIVKHDRQDIVDVFATFYEVLYARRGPEDTRKATGVPNAKYQQSQLRKLASN